MADDIDYDFLVKDLGKHWTELKDNLCSGKVLWTGADVSTFSFVDFSTGVITTPITKNRNDAPIKLKIQLKL